MNGHEDPVLTPAQKRLLRRYVDEGGFILAEACCGTPAFTEGFKKLLADKDMFGDEAVLEPLAPTHAIWSAHSLVPASLFQGDQVPVEKKILALERGCKTVLVFSPQPLAGYWEEPRFTPKVGEVVGDPGPGQAGVPAGREHHRLRHRVRAAEAPAGPPEDPRPEGRRGEGGGGTTSSSARSATTAATGNRPRTPCVLAAANAAGTRYLIDVSLVKQEVRLTRTKELFRTKFLYMHGKAACTIDETEAANTRAHLDPGRTLLADACGGSAALDKASRDFMAKVYPDKKLEVIPAQDFLYSEKLNGEAITKLRCRREKADGTPQPTFEDVPPLLEGIQVDGRWVVIYSKYDIGCALEKNKSSACKGYDPDSALKLATAALLYSLKR